MNTSGCGVSRHVPRILLSLVYIVGGVGFLMNFAGAQKMVAMGLAPWGLASIALIATIVAIVLKLGGSLMLLFNYRANIGAWMLIVFTLMATLMFHMHWGGADGQMQMTNFLKNLGLVDGLMLYAGCLCKQCKLSREEA